uniref:SH3 domain-containing protein n=2 Tax=Photinus pyralis TaxID=7054 RepID=A0A1Y1M256_PHOPY
MISIMALDTSNYLDSCNGTGTNGIHLPMIVRIFGDGAPTDVPVTPDTTCSDVIECCRDPGDESCNLVAVCPQRGECALRETDHPLEILQRWGSGRLVLRYTVLSANGSTYEKRNGMKEPDHFGETLPEGVQLTLSELREMACRQQAQIDSQHQLLAAKEQRLRYLKDQEARQQRVQAETERLRRLRDRVDAQELKLRKLRALRGQVDHHKQNNISLTSDLESIRALFNEKEKELSLAVAKVEELTRQLEELRRGRSRDQAPPASALELDKLRRELMYRNKLNEQQNQRLNQQREALTARQEEMSSIDKRISELQERLHRKRLLNQQLATQISAASNKTAYHQLVRLTGSTDQCNQFYGRKSQHLPNGLQRGNIATVEPYNHVPLPLSKPPLHCGLQEQTPTYHPVYQPQNHHIINTKPDIEHQEQEEINKVVNHYPPGPEDSDALKEFSVSKSDPKYQTLPYNTKFTVNVLSNRVNNRIPDNNDNNVNNDLKDVEQIQTISTNSNIQSQHMTVHSAPLSVINKNIATPLNQNDLLVRKNSEPVMSTTQNNEETKNNANKHQSAELNSSPYQKPISSVAPTSVQHFGKISTIYQTSSIKVQPVEPQTVTNNQKHLPVPTANQSPNLPLSPPQANSTPISTPEDKVRPALPPKPAIKPPPRQTQIPPESDAPNPDPPDDKPAITNHRLAPQPPTNQTKNVTFSQTNQKSTAAPENMPIIKAKPLTIKKQPLSEQPKLRNSMPKQNGFSSTNRRIEIPPAFHFNDVVAEKVPEEVTKGADEVDKVSLEENDSVQEKEEVKSINDNVIRRCRKGNLKQNGKANLSRRVSFDPLALLLDASLEGELELVKKTAGQVPNPSAANDEGITALHNAICAGHFEIVKFLVEFGCDVNAQDSDGWTPLHCAASCNNVAMVKFLVEHGACIFATTLSDHETAAEKCEEDEEGFDGCSEYLYSVQEKLGILSGGIVYAVFDYTAQQPDELSFNAGQQLTVLRKGDESEREWWWSRLDDKEGYIPRNLLGLYPRVSPKED